MPLKSSLVFVKDIDVLICVLSLQYIQLGRLVINFVLPWGNFISYFYRPEGTNSGPYIEGHEEIHSERLWKDFLTGNKVSIREFLFQFFEVGRKYPVIFQYILLNY